MLLEGILVGIFGNAIFDIIKTSVKDFVEDKDDDLKNRIYESLERAAKYFFEQHGDIYIPENSFLAREKNIELIIESYNYSNHLDLIEVLDRRSFGNTPDVSEEHLLFFVETLCRITEEDFLLSKIKEEKKHYYKSEKHYEESKEFREDIKELINSIPTKDKNQPDSSFRELHRDERIIRRIEYLNTEFDSTFHKINNRFLNRKESEKCYEELLNGNSVVIHGKAGSGKSGSIIELKNRLKKENIVHLALKLDRRVPENSSNNFGKQLELPASPVYCIDTMAKEKEAVLILDQLDAIRWTNSHSSTALEVCKEMINEVKNINMKRDKKLTLVFVCRTFDFQNDNGLKQLFSNMSPDTKKIAWKEIKMSDLNDQTVKEVVGVTYDNLSIKLKTLLKTPSNLYIWSNLEEDRRLNTFKSSIDLISEWWKQLRLNCERLGVSSSDINELRDTIVNHIDKSGKLMIPMQMVNHCSQVAMEQLQSNGLLFSDGKRIGFVHQSFYDYFLVEKIIQRIFEGHSIISLLGPPSEQNPSKRYQLQMLLENLLDIDLNDFINTGTELINSENVRFYMKYVFLEVLGQADSINSKVEEFLKDHINSDYWREHLIDVVFMNNPIYIEFLIQEGYINNWLHNEEDRGKAFLLLKSVNSELSNEVTSLLYPLAFKNPELDNKIYNVLCWDIADDSDTMFEFRMEILKFRPERRIDYIDWESISKKNAIRAVFLFYTLVKNANSQFIESKNDLNRNIHMNNEHRISDKEKEALIEAAKDIPHQVWDEFMPYLVEATKDTSNIYDERLDFWIFQRKSESLYGRAYVEMVKASAQVLIDTDAGIFLEKCEEYYNIPSYLVNEILLSIMESLPNDYSDYALSWLIDNPQKRLFNYTGESDEYLDSAKSIIRKHSKACSVELFKDLEDALYYYHEEDELEIAKRRFEYNKENRQNQNKWQYYFPYWGEVQYYLLPALDQHRISNKTYELKRILKRKFNGQNLLHKRNTSIGGFVGSTIGSKAEKISDKQWLKIIEKKDFQTEKWPKKNGAILESSPWQFSNDLKRIGKKDPSRIANLALKFPLEIDNHYISAVFDTIGKKETSKDMDEVDDWKPVNFDLAQSLYRKWEKNDDFNVVVSFCRGIRERAEEAWDKDILDNVSNIAMYHPHPEKGEFNVISSEDKEGKKVESLLTNSMNCVRGCAAQAIASLLWEDKDRYDVFKAAVNSLVKDKNIAVNMSAIECILPVMNIDKEQAVEWFFQLVNKDIRIAAHPYAYRLFYHLYKDYSDAIKELVLKMYHSELEDVIKIGANHIANMNVLYGNFEDIVFNHPYKSRVQKEGIIRIAADLIGYREHHDNCKKIIEHFLEDEMGDDDLTFSYSQLLNEDKLNIKEDEELILKIVTSKSNRRLIRSFVDYMNETDASIKVFKDVIFGMSQNIIRNSQQEVKDIGSELYGIASELSKLIALLYDRTRDDFEVNQRCLDIWDDMFENRIGTIRELTRTIMDM